AAADGEQAVVVHAPGDDFEAVGDDLARHETVAHTLVAHHDAVGCGRGAEKLRHAAAGADALDGLARQAVEVSVAWRDVAVQRRDADHRPREVVVEKADGAKHGAIGCAAGAGGGLAAGLVGVARHGVTLFAQSEGEMSSLYLAMR